MTVALLLIASFVVVCAGVSLVQAARDARRAGRSAALALLNRAAVMRIQFLGMGTHAAFRTLESPARDRRSKNRE
ncbi:MAG: hypothetical protein AAF170_19945 [Bacteroidota bacterium]